MQALIRLILLAAVLPLMPLALAQVRLGSDVLAADGFRELQGKRVGLITNPSGVNRSGESTIDLLRRAPGVKLVALFGPEHGVYGDVKAGELIGERTDKRTGLPGWFTALDADKDEQISLFEWRQGGKPITEFQEMDLNGDGLITKDEYLRWAKMKMIEADQKRREEGRP